MAEKQGKEKQGGAAAQEENKQQAGNRPPDDRKDPIERLKEIHGIPDAVYRGMMAMQGWKPGRTASAGEFLAARDSFLHESASGAHSAKAEGTV